MNPLACFSTALWINSKGNHFTLHSWLSWAELALLPLSLVGLYAVIHAARMRNAPRTDLESNPSPKGLKITSVVAASRPATSRIISMSWWRNFATRILNSLSRSGRVGEKRGTAKIGGAVILCIVIALSWVDIDNHREIASLKRQLWTAQEKQRRQEEVPPDLVIMHRVEVLNRISEKTFHAQVQNPATGEWTEFDVTSCPGHPKTTNEIQAGVTLPLLQYVEDHAHSCQILDGRWGGYTLLRDTASVPILTAFKEGYANARQTTTSNTNP